MKFNRDLTSEWLTWFIFGGAGLHSKINPPAVLLTRLCRSIARIHRGRSSGLGLSVLALMAIFGFDRTSVAQPVVSGVTRELHWSADDLQNGKIAAPNVQKLPRLFHDDFDNPESGFPTGITNTIENTYANGRYIIDVPGSNTFSIFHFPTSQPYPNCALQISGRVVGLETDIWGIRIANYPLHWVNVTLNGKGELWIDPDDDMEPGRGPRIGPIKHPAIKTGEKFNVLLLVIRGRVLEVYVNDVAVCDPVTTDRDLSPCIFSFRTRRPTPATGEKRSMRAEFEYASIFSAEPMKKPEARGAVIKNVTPPTAAPGELASGPPVLIGDLGDEKFVRERLTVSSGPKVVFDIENRLYQILAKQPGRYRADVSKLNKVSNFSCQAFARLDRPGNGGWGLAIGATPTGRFEIVLRDEDGKRQLHMDYVAKDGQQDEVIPDVPCPAARSMTDNNCLRVETNGKQIRIFVNGILIAEKDDSRLAPGGIHPLVVAETPPIDARFSFVHVWKLKPPPPAKPGAASKAAEK